MDGDRTARAKARIEAALARIEAGARGSERPADGGELAHLKARHDRLRAKVQQSLDQLDLLIEGTEG